ncbi:MAG TPA: hypothetical protein VF044_03735 [Actinomycetota bacterium]
MQRSHRSRWRAATVLGTAVLALAITGTAFAVGPGRWKPAVNAESVPGTSEELNTEFVDGCPIQAPSGRRLFRASTRPGGAGGIDIWVARRASTADPWGAPANLAMPVNSTVDDFCPTPVRGKGLFFVSTREGGCGGSDIFRARRDDDGDWRVRHLRCRADGGPNTDQPEFAPSFFEADGRGYLYFSSGPDIYEARQRRDGTFRRGVAVEELNSEFNDLRPNVRSDGRVIVFDSDRPGGLGGPDIYTARRRNASVAWSAPVNVGTNVNTDAAETRASLSWDGRTMLFGSTRPGGEGETDIYVTRRKR